MKIDSANITIDSSAKFATESFDFGDKRIIMQILRGKIYSNPIKTILQEIGCNARDAHREIGKAEVPIKIKLPTKLDETFYIQDYGPGITPDRMSNVFIKYGNSTKRESNDQTGGFGLGAKTPFAYVDLFNIITISEENGKHVKRVYVAYIDETEVGAMACTSEEETTEATGTTISFTPKKTDYYKFEEYTHEVFRFWATKPEVISDNEVSWEEDSKPIMNTDTWSFMGSGEDDFIILDEIAYPIKWAELGNKNYHLENNGIILKFNTGEIKITANREQIEYTDESIEAIKEKLKPIKKEISKRARAEVEGCKTYLEAVNKWYKVKNSYPIRDSEAPKWNDIEISRTMDLPGRSYAILYTYHNDKLQKEYTNRYNRNAHTSHIDLTSDIIILQNDTKRDTISYPKVKHKLATEGKKKVYVVRFVKGDDGVAKKPKEWRYLETTRMSTLPKAPRKATGGSGGGSTGTVISKAKKLQHWTPKKEWPIEELDFTNGAGIYMLLKGQQAFLEWPYSVDRDVLRNIANVLQVGKEHKVIDPSLPLDIFGIREKYVDKLGSKWISVTDLLVKIRDEFNKKPLIEIESPRSAMDGHYLGRSLEEVVNRKLLPEDHLLCKWVALSKKSESCEVFIDTIREIDGILDSKVPKLKPKKPAKKRRRKLNKKKVSTQYSFQEGLLKKYPLFNHIDTISWSDQKGTATELANYMRMQDEISKSH